MQPRRRAPVLALFALLLLVAPSVHDAAPLARAAGPPSFPSLSGYVRMSDGVDLRYHIVLPAATGTFPVALIYDGYGDGNDPTGPTANEAAMATFLVQNGYAVMGANVRGTGCSGGVFDVLDPQWSRDGNALVEWAAAQPWSTGHVGMFGYSFPGIAGLLTAATQPPHLDAVASTQVTADFYRDALYPGGIYNEGFVKMWTAILAAQGDPPTDALATQDVECLANMANSAHANARTMPLLELAKHPYADAWTTTRAPLAHVADIRVPVLAATAWQDDALSGRSGAFYWDRLDPARTWLVASNGYHGVFEQVRTPYYDTLVAFFDHFLKGESNGFDVRPHLELWHESTADASCSVTTPGWTTSFASIHPDITPRVLALGWGGALLDALDGLAGRDAYVYPGASSYHGTGLLPGMCETANEPAWQAARDSPSSSVAYTSAPFAANHEFYGSGSLDLWVSTSAPDTDLQATITEVRPDGHEVYVQRGWLRLSHRALDVANSTELRPLQTHAFADAQPIANGAPVAARVEIFPFDHVFRAGSRLRVTIEAPTGVTGDVWRLDFLKTPAVNAIVHDAAHPSRLVLGEIAASASVPALPACGGVLNEPCR